MRELDTNNHSVFAMYYHLVLVVKYRRKVINEDVSVRLQEIYRKPKKARCIYVKSVQV